MATISVVIPVRVNGSPKLTLQSLRFQKFKDFEIIISWDENKGANWARNRGAVLAKSDFILFSDDDIFWRKNGIEDLYLSLASNSKAAYSYGAYMMEGKIYCNTTFNPELLKHYNYISTMSLIRRSCFTGFDESIERLQDWALWLAMLRKGYKGVFCNSIIFDTNKRPGITFGSNITWEQAKDIVLEKYGN